MAFFRKARNDYTNASNFFKKEIIAPSSNFFRKGGPAERSLDTASVNLRKIGNTFVNVHHEANKVLDSPIAESLAHLAGPNGLAAHQALRGANQAVGLSQLTHRGNYRGSEGNVTIFLNARSTYTRLEKKVTKSISSKKEVFL